jgi:hypothetical protein
MLRMTAVANDFAAVNKWFNIRAQRWWDGSTYQIVESTQLIELRQHSQVCRDDSRQSIVVKFQLSELRQHCHLRRICSLKRVVVKTQQIQISDGIVPVNALLERLNQVSCASIPI